MTPEQLTEIEKALERYDNADGIEERRLADSFIQIDAIEWLRALLEDNKRLVDLCEKFHWGSVELEYELTQELQQTREDNKRLNNRLETMAEKAAESFESAVESARELEQVRRELFNREK